MASSSTTIANETIWLTGLDVAAVAGDGKYLYEKKMAQAFKAFAQNFRVSGLVIPGSSANLNITIALGEAVISGFYCEIPATQVAAFASVTNHVFLKLTRDGSNKVTGAQYEVNDTGTAPADSLKIGTLTASGAAITATTHSGRTGRVVRRMPSFQVFNSSGSFTCPDDVTEVTVEVWGAGGGGAGGQGGSTMDTCTGATGPASNGAKGFRGGYVADVITLSPGSQYVITIGAGGAAGTPGAGAVQTGNSVILGAAGGAGGTGGATSFAALLTANGGVGGTSGGGAMELTGESGGSGGGIIRKGHGKTGGPGGAGGAAAVGAGANGSAGATGIAGESGQIVVWY